MSGGSLDYICHRMEDALDEIESRVQDPGPEQGHPDADRISELRRWAASEPEARDAVRAVLPALRAAERCLHDIEWWLSGDYGPERVVAACEEFLRAVAQARAGT